MAKEYTLSAERLEELQKELVYLKTVREKEVAELIKEARSFGDLSENSEYDEAKNEQGKIAMRIAELEDMIANAHVVDESELDASVVNVGSTVEVLRVENGALITYQLGGAFGSDPKNGIISDESPIGMAIKGARVGETVEVVTPNGNVFHLEIMGISR